MWPAPRFSEGVYLTERNLSVWRRGQPLGPPSPSSHSLALRSASRPWGEGLEPSNPKGEKVMTAPGTSSWAAGPRNLARSSFEWDIQWPTVWH